MEKIGLKIGNPIQSWRKVGIGLDFNLCFYQRLGLGFTLIFGDWLIVCLLLTKNGAGSAKNGAGSFLALTKMGQDRF